MVFFFLLKLETQVDRYRKEIRDKNVTLHIKN